MGKACAGILLLVLGVSLLGLSITGRWTSMGRYASFPPRTWERFDPALAESTPDLESLYRAAQTRAPRPLSDMSPPAAMQVLYETVADRFTHGERAIYSPFGNWVLWALGIVNRRYRDIQDPDALLRGGHSALCGDVSYVLMRMAGTAGIPTRHVLLEGHIVMEARYDGGWHVYDPDLEVVARDDSGVVADAETLSRRTDLVRQSYAGRGDPSYVESIVAIYGSTGDNMFLEYPERRLFGPSGQRPGRVEQAAHYMAFILPGVLIAAGVVLMARRRPGRRYP